ncbi:glycosyltransferase family 9 protein [Sporocytophaga myxococcoides]|uniref:glycosyltransferase family 9 protein n=1 Tax=Sporocytophaga myxococcoides TaxID=153721 RepID=UPI00040A6BC6|nr:glycosyltransferase family 9 protein [Sporocytophaga myxococcoides]
MKYGFPSGSIDKKEVKKIGILRANALGDFIVTLPAIQSLSHFFPNAEIILLGKEWHKFFLEEKNEGGLKRTCINRVIVIPVMNGLREEPGMTENSIEVESFFTSIKKENFDLVISFQGKGNAAIPFLKRLNSKYTIGLSCEDSDQPDCSLSFHYYQSELIRYLEVASLAGAPLYLSPPKINLFQRDYSEAKDFLNANNIKNRFIAIHTCGKDIRRMWTKEKFSDLSKLLVNSGFIVILTGSEEDKKYNDEIVNMSGIDIYNSSGKFSIGGLAALYNISSLVISIDTGALHVAIAAQAKTVGLYWAPNLINWAPLTREKHRPVIGWDIKCSVCGIAPVDPYPFEPHTEKCQHQQSFIESISVEEVYKAAMTLTR